MGCPGGTRSVFTCAFGAEENFNVYFSGKRRSLLHPNTAQRSFFPIIYNLFLRKLKEKLARKACVNTDVSTVFTRISDCAHIPWASHNTP